MKPHSVNLHDRRVIESPEYLHLKKIKCQDSSLYGSVCGRNNDGSKFTDTPKIALQTKIGVLNI